MKPLSLGSRCSCSASRSPPRARPRSANAERQIMASVNRGPGDPTDWSPCARTTACGSWPTNARRPWPTPGRPEPRGRRIARSAALAGKRIQWYGYGEVIAYSTAQSSSAAARAVRTCGEQPIPLGVADQQLVQLPGDRARRVEFRPDVWVDRADGVEGPNRRAGDVDRGKRFRRRRPAGRGAARIPRCRRIRRVCATSRSSSEPMTAAGSRSAPAPRAPPGRRSTGPAVTGTACASAPGTGPAMSGPWSAELRVWVP